MVWEKVETTHCETDELLLINKEFLGKSRETNVTCFVLQDHHPVLAGVAHVVHDKLRDDLGWLQNLLQRGQSQNGLQTGEKESKDLQGMKEIKFHIYSKTLGELKCCLITSPFQEDNWGHFSLAQTATVSKEEHLWCLK